MLLKEQVKLILQHTPDAGHKMYSGIEQTRQVEGNVVFDFSTVGSLSFLGEIYLKHCRVRFVPCPEHVVGASGSSVVFIIGFLHESRLHCVDNLKMWHGNADVMKTCCWHPCDVFEGY